MTFTHDELKARIWDICAPKPPEMPTADAIIAAVHACIKPDYATESDIVLCQNCREPFTPKDDEWFCPECVATVPEFELDLKRKNAQYYFTHGGAQ